MIFEEKEKNRVNLMILMIALAFCLESFSGSIREGGPRQAQKTH